MEDPKPPSSDVSDLYPVPALPVPALPGPATRSVPPDATAVTPVPTPPVPGEPVLRGTDPVVYDPHGPEVITYLREYDGVLEWELPRDVVQFHGGGSRKNQICLPDRGLSGTHFLLERRDRGIRVYDLHSLHGTWVMDSPITTADLRPGSKFTAPPVSFVAMNDAMRRHRADLVDIIGTRWMHSPDWLMVEAASSGHMLILGERTCGRDQLALAIHAMSPRALREPIVLPSVPTERAVQVDLVKRAAKDAATIGTTVILTLSPKSLALDPSFLSMLYSTAFGVRVIVLADAVEHARSALTEPIVSLCQQVLLRPLAYRADDIDQLLDRRFTLRGAAHLRAADLVDENLAALKAHTWPENLEELYYIADLIVAYETQGGWRAAVPVLETPKSTLENHAKRIGLKTFRFRIHGHPRETIRHSFFKPTSPHTGGHDE